jgi:hypothetical protein
VPPGAGALLGAERVADVAASLGEAAAGDQDAPGDPAATDAEDETDDEDGDTVDEDDAAAKVADSEGIGGAEYTSSTSKALPRGRSLASTGAQADV